MVMISFGTPVTVHRVAHRLKSYGTSTVHTSYRDTIRYGEVVDSRWQGEPLPDSEVDPDHKCAVMIRRYPLLKPSVGIVVGEVWREEGYVDGGSWGEQNYLSRKGPRVHLYEVAMSVSAGPNGRLPKARLELVHELDLEEL